MNDAPTREGVTPSLPWRAQLFILGAAGAVVLLLALGLPLMIHLFAPKPPPVAPAPPAGQFVASDQQWATLTFAAVRSLDFSDEVLSDGKIAVDDDRTTQVFSPYSGRVTHVFAKAGDKVSVGQPLFAIQASEFVQGQSDLATAQAQVTLTRAEEARKRALYKTDDVALKDWQQSQADLAAAQAGLAAARARMGILGVAGSEIDALQRRSPGMGFVAETTVRSPIDGVVTQRAIGEGQTIASPTNGATNPAIVVSDLSRVWLVGALREIDSPKAKVGQPLAVHVLAFPDKTFAAKVDYVSPTVDPNSRRVTVRAEIANPGGLLKPEMFATIGLSTDGPNVSVGAPADAVIYEGDTARVWVAHPGHRLELRQISTGRATAGMVEVTSGLRPGELVVTGGALFIDRASQGD